MSGSHRAERPEAPDRSRSTKLLTIAVVAVLLIGAAAFAISKYVGGCGNAPTFTVAADPSIAPVVKRLVEDNSTPDLGCADLTVKATEPAAVLDAVAKNRQVPAIWIPDSALWLARAGQSTGMPVDVASDSIAVTPTAVIGPEGKAPAVNTWVDTLRLEGLQLGDPLSSTVSSAPIVGSLAEAEANKSNPKIVSAVMVPIAQAQASKPPVTDQAKRIERVQSGTGSSVVSEQQLVASKSQVAATVPKQGSVFLNYPLAITEPSSGEHDLAKKSGLALAAILASGDGLSSLGKAGFRTPNGAPLSDDRGVGKVEQITLSDKSAISAALKNYAILALPTRALAIEDVSGSMAFPSGNETRMDLTIKASQRGIGLFPDTAQLGIWSFSTNLDGERDYKPLIRIRRMDAKVDGGSQREALIDVIGGLKPKIGGGTGLYDSTLAAFREVKKGYDPKAVNSVIVLTDGANDDAGSISLKKLIATLKKEQDPTRPVIIVTIGVTEDADAETLEQISAATGGSSFVARAPADIVDVFVKALQSRGQ